MGQTKFKVGDGAVFKVTLSWSYVPTPEFYPSDDVDEMIAIDRQYIKDDPDLFIPKEFDVHIEAIGGSNR